MRTPGPDRYLRRAKERSPRLGLFPQVWASDHSIEFNLFCPLPPPCPIVQRLQKSKLFVSLSACPQCPSGVLAISHRAGWTLGSGYAAVDGRRQGHRLLLMSPCSWCPLFTLHLPCPLFSSLVHLGPPLCMSLHSLSSVSSSSEPL